jgi:hypothetical protein
VADSFEGKIVCSLKILPAYIRFPEFDDDYFWIDPVMFLNLCKSWILLTD